MGPKITIFGQKRAQNHDFSVFWPLKNARVGQNLGSRAILRIALKYPYIIGVFWAVNRPKSAFLPKRPKIALLYTSILR